MELWKEPRFRNPWAGRGTRSTVGIGFVVRCEDERSSTLSGVSSVTNWQEPSDQMRASLLDGSTKLYGRDEEIQLIQQAYQETANGKSRVLRIEGPSGSGKTKLIERTISDCILHHHQNNNESGLFVSGKFDQYSNSTPYAGIVAALTDLNELILLRDDRAHVLASLQQQMTHSELQQFSQLVYNVSYLINTNTNTNNNYHNHHATIAPALISDTITSWNNNTINSYGNLDNDTSHHKRSSSSSMTVTTTASTVLNESKVRYLCRTYIQAIAEANRPVVLLLDDIQWANSETMNVVRYFIEEEEGEPSCHVLFVLVHREEHRDKIVRELQLPMNEDGQENEKGDGEKKTQDDSTSAIISRTIPITTISIQNLCKEDVAQLLSGVLMLHTTFVKPLADVVYEKTSGNPYAIFQFLELLYTQEFLYRCYRDHSQQPTVDSVVDDCDDSVWSWDLSKIKSETNKTDNVVDYLLTAKLERVSAKLRVCLIVASFLGFRFDIDTFHLVLRDIHQWTCPTNPAWDLSYRLLEEVTESEGAPEGCMEECVREGLLEKRDGGKSKLYKFAHDRVQEAILNTIAKERHDLRLKVGRALLREAKFDKQRYCFLAADTLNGVAREHFEEEELPDLVELNYSAAELVVCKGAFELTCQYLDLALELCNDWENRYQTTLKLWTLYAKAKCLRGNYDQALNLATLIISHAKALPDKYSAYETKLTSLMEIDNLQAIAEGTAMSSDFGYTLPQNPTKLQVVLELVRTKRTLRGKSDSDLLQQPVSFDTNLHELLRMWNDLSLAAFRANNQPLLWMLSLRNLRLTMEHGCNPYSAMAFAMYAAVCAKMGDINETCRFGNLAWLAHEKLPKSFLKVNLVAVTECFCFHFVNSLEKSVERFRTAYEESLNNGEYSIYTFYCGAQIFLSMFHTGAKLASLNPQIDVFLLQSSRFGHQPARDSVVSLQVMLHTLMGESDHASAAEKEARLLCDAKKQNNIINQAAILGNRLIRIWFFDQYDDACSTIRLLETLYTSRRQPHWLRYIFNFYQALALYKLHAFKRKRKFRMAARRCKRRIDILADNGCPNCIPLAKILWAEEIAASPRPSHRLDVVLKAFEAAAALAMQHGLVHCAAYAQERAAYCLMHKLRWRTETRQCLVAAANIYEEWGALGKVEDLEHHHFTLLMSRERTVVT